MIRVIAFLSIFIFAAPSATGADVITGRASVIDGDTIEIHGTRIRLFGIDAPESGQTCIVNSKAGRCGQQAAFALADKVAGRTVSCEASAQDQYRRMVAVCRSGGEDLNAWMVAQGWAMAYRQYSADYVRQEEQASASKRGIWQGRFVAPSDWRRGKRIGVAETGQRLQSPPTSSQKPSACQIKGNISRNGRIYHMPGGQYYGRTRIDTSRGERWFCSEAEAQAAGWRRSRR